MIPHFGSRRRQPNKRKETQMKKILLALGMLLSLSTETFAQHAGTDQDEKACTPDVERLCRKWMDQGDLAILACLKDNRTRLRPACRDVLISHGQ
jgi:hypothetical protein